MARIDAVFSVLCRQEDLLLLPSQGQAETLRQRLQGQIFFMDKVTVTDESGNLRRLRLLGPTAVEILPAAGLPHPSPDDLFLEAEGVTVLRQERFDLPGYEIIVPDGMLDALQERLTAQAHYLSTTATVTKPAASKWGVLSLDRTDRCFHPPWRRA